MHNWENILREYKKRTNTRNPSFSSTLLDEIYREIDSGGDEKHEDLKRCNDKSVKKRSLDSNNGGGRALTSTTTSYEDEEMASLRRACLIEKWMGKKVDSKVYTRRRSSSPEFDRKLMHDNDPLFFSSGSSCSDSSFGGFSFKSSETESFGAVKTKSSCFTAPRPKPVKTGKLEHSAREQSDFYLSGYYYNHQTNKTKENLIRSKPPALQIYANLKKMKQPVSPGGRLTSFINNIFTNGHSKKNKNLNIKQSYGLNGNADWKAKSTLSSTCSSATSFSRSCLSKRSPNSREKRKNGLKRSVRFFPVSVIVDEDSRPCGHKTINNKDVENNGRKASVVHHVKDQTSYYKGSHEFLRSCQNQKKDELIAKNELQVDNDDYEDDDDDVASDSSSDLFELDHLQILKSDGYCDDLPVYETTDFGLNRAIASGLIR